MVSNEGREDAYLFHALFVNVDDPDSVALTKDVIFGERDAAIFGEAKKSKIHAERCNQDEAL